MERKRRRGWRLRGDINSCPSFPQWTAQTTSRKVFEGRCKFSEKYTNENSIMKESSTFCYRYVFTLLKNKQEFQDWLKKPKRQGRFVFFLQTSPTRAVSLFCWLHTKTALSWRLLPLPSCKFLPPQHPRKAPISLHRSCVTNWILKAKKGDSVYLFGSLILVGT